MQCTGQFGWGKDSRPEKQVGAMRRQVSAVELQIRGTVVAVVKRFIESKDQTSEMQDSRCRTSLATSNSLLRRISLSRGDEMKLITVVSIGNVA